MKLRLKQLDILNNKNIDPYIDEINFIGKDNYYSNLSTRIDRRYNQINNIYSLLENNLNEEEYMNKVLNTYDFTYDYNIIMNSNLVSNENISFIVRSKSDINFERKIYTIKEIVSLYTYNNILFDSINMVEFDLEYMKKYYELDNVEFINRKELLSFYKYIKEVLNDFNLKNKYLINDVKNILTKERLQDDLDNLFEFTNNEISIINNSKRLKLV